MPGMKPAGEEDKGHASQQYKESDESEPSLLLLHVIAVSDEDERRLVVSHAYPSIFRSASSWPGVSH